MKISLETYKKNVAELLCNIIPLALVTLNAGQNLFTDEKKIGSHRNVVSQKDVQNTMDGVRKQRLLK